MRCENQLKMIHKQQQKPSRMKAKPQKIVSKSKNFLKNGTAQCFCLPVNWRYAHPHPLINFWTSVWQTWL